MLGYKKTKWNKYFPKKNMSKSSSGAKVSGVEQKRPCIELNMDEIVSDLGIGSKN